MLSPVGAAGVINGEHSDRDAQGGPRVGTERSRWLPSPPRLPAAGRAQRLGVGEIDRALGRGLYPPTDPESSLFPSLPLPGPGRHPPRPEWPRRLPEGAPASSTSHLSEATSDHGLALRRTLWRHR